MKNFKRVTLQIKVSSLVMDSTTQLVKTACVVSSVALRGAGRKSEKIIPVDVISVV